MAASTQAGIVIRDPVLADIPYVVTIYKGYIKNTTVTFEDDALTEASMQQRIECSGPSDSWIVLGLQGEVAGYTCITPWKPRAAYARAKESSVYLHPDYQGQGLGLVLMQNLIDKIRHGPIHVVIAGIALPNQASIALHEKLGFCAIGKCVEVGYKFGRYVGYWQLLLEDA